MYSTRTRKGLQRISNFLGSFVVLSQQTFTVTSTRLRQVIDFYKFKLRHGFVVTNQQLGFIGADDSAIRLKQSLAV